jgi:hypothetical protein
VNDPVRSYKLVYAAGTLKPFWLDLCPRHVGERLTNGASVLERRTPVSKPICSDCDPKASLR